MATSQQQQAILASLGRNGWNVISAVPEMVKVAADSNALPGSPAAVAHSEPSGNETWVISDGKGHNQELTVKPPAAVGSSVDWPTDSSGNPTVPAGAGNTYQVVKPPADLPAAATNAPAALEHLVIGGVTYEKGTDGQWNKVNVPGNEPTPTAASGRTAAENALSQAQADAVTGKTPAEIAQLVASGALSQAQADAVKNKTPAEIQQLVASAAASTASAANANASAAATTAKTPAEIAQLQAQAAQGNAAAAKTLQEIAQAAIPKYTYGEATPTSGPQQSVIDPTTGLQTFRPNPNTADPTARAQLLQQQAQAKHDDIQKQVLNGAIDGDEGLRQWNEYWNTTIEPQKQQLQQLQAQQTFTDQNTASATQNARDQTTTSVAADQLSAANTGAATGSNLLQARMQQAAGLFNNTMGIATGSKNYGIGPGGAPDVSGLPNAISAWLTAQGGGQSTFDTASNLVKNIDPNNSSGFAAHAAAALHQVLDRASQTLGGAYQPGGPVVPQGPDYAAALNQAKYGGAFAPPPAQLPTTAPTTTIAPDGTVTIAHSLGAAAGAAGMAAMVPSFGPGNNP
jgi:hypothetical protein